MKLETLLLINEVTYKRISPFADGSGVENNTGQAEQKKDK